MNQLIRDRAVISALQDVMIKHNVSLVPTEDGLCIAYDDDSTGETSIMVETCEECTCVDMIYCEQITEQLTDQINEKLSRS